MQRSSAEEIQAQDGDGDEGEEGPGMPNPTGINGHANKFRPSDEDLRAAFERYDAEKLSWKVIKERLVVELQYPIGRSKYFTERTRVGQGGVRKQFASTPKDETTALVLEEIGRDEKGKKGPRSIHKALADRGIRIPRDFVIKVMRENDKEGFERRRPVKKDGSSSTPSPRPPRAKKARTASPVQAQPALSTEGITSHEQAVIQAFLPAHYSMPALPPASMPEASGSRYAAPQAPPAAAQPFQVNMNYHAVLDPSLTDLAVRSTAPNVSGTRVSAYTRPYGSRTEPDLQVDLGGPS